MSDELQPIKYQVFGVVPNAGAIMPCTHSAVACATRKHVWHDCPSQFGDIEHNFNMAWCNALNGRVKYGYTHFAMIHSDIGAEEAWLDILLDEMDRVDADIMTTVLPIKDYRGLTTTGIRYPGVWGTRRFTMREVAKFPETFCVTDTDEPDQILAINTGLWVCRIPLGGWCDKFSGFTCKHEIRVIDDEFSAAFDSEDWLFSDWASTLGLKVYATRKVKAFHRGGNDFPNQGDWGHWETEHQRPTRPIDWRLAKRPAPNITVETEKPIALDSLDHTQPLGAANDNSLSHAFNRKLFDLIPVEELRVLDLGCSGGAFVRSILEAGGFAVGIDGSDFSFKARRAEWATIPDYLFMADATAPFLIKNCEPEPAKFNVVTGWEFFEHIAEEDIFTVLDNIVAHVADGALLIASISASVEPHHRTAKPKEWWVGAIHDMCGSRVQMEFFHAPDLEEHFGEDLVRGSNKEGAISRSVIFRCNSPSLALSR